jgi:hypothetical protein
MSMLIYIAKCIYIYISKIQYSHERAHISIHPLHNCMMYTVILKSMMNMYHHTMQGQNFRGGGGGG